MNANKRRYTYIQEEQAKKRRPLAAMRHFCEGLTIEFMETHRATEWLKIEDLAEGVFGKEKP